MGRVIFFEIHADDLARAKTFYETTFDWKIEKEEHTEDYWAIRTGDDNTEATKEWGGVNGALIRRQGQSPTYDNPVSAFVCSVDVDDIDAACSKVVENAGNVIVDKRPLKGMGWFCYCKDTEGNIFGLWQSDETAV